MDAVAGGGHLALERFEAGRRVGASDEGPHVLPLRELVVVLRHRANAAQRV
jgi:hypothetical protein